MARVVILSDLHCGHAVGLTPPQHQGAPAGMLRGRKEKLVGIQAALWEWFSKRIKALGNIDVLIVNGDAVDGKGRKSGGTEQITVDMNNQVEIASDCIKFCKANEIHMTYGCLTAGHRILTADMRWVPVESLVVGDALLGFDEEPEGAKTKRRFRGSRVLANIPLLRDVYDVRLSDGTTLTATPDHPFLVRSRRPYRWKTVSELRSWFYDERGRRKKVSPLEFQRSFPVWDENKSYESGYLAGFFDGEGCCSYGERTRKNNAGRPEFVFHLMATQKAGAVIDTASSMLAGLGVSHTITGKARDPEIRDLRITGSYAEKLAFLGSVRPVRLLGKLDAEKLGAARTGFVDSTTIVDIVPAGQQVVWGLSTTSKTYVSEGFLSHNTGYHTGDEEDWEDAIFREVKARSIKAHNWVQVRGLVFDCKHHLGSSGVPHARATAISRERLWNILWTEHAEAPKGDVIIRSHVHYFNYAGGSNWLGMSTPALQGLGTKYGGRRCSGTVDFGFVHFDVAKDGSYTWEKHIAKIPAQNSGVTETLISRRLTCSKP